jgi:hypothetical protein
MSFADVEESRVQPSVADEAFAADEKIGEAAIVGICCARVILADGPCVWADLPGKCRHWLRKQEKWSW